MSNLTPVRLDLLLALAPASPTPEEAFDKAASAPDGAEKSESFDFQPAEQDKAINDASDSADFIPAALAAELESQNIKRQCSNDGSLMKMSSVSHKNKKVCTSNSSRRSSVGLLGGPFVHDQEFDDDDGDKQEKKPSENETQDKVEQEIDTSAPARQDDSEVTTVREDREASETAERPMEQEEPVAESKESQTLDKQQPAPKHEAAEKHVAQAEKPKEPTSPEANKEGATVVTETAAGEEKSAAPMLARRGSGVRCPGKIVIPKCLNSQPSSSSSPNFKDTKKPPLPQTPKAAVVEPPNLVQEGAVAKLPSASVEPAMPEKVEPKKVIPVPKRGKSKSPLSASPREREDAAFPASLVQPPSNKSPSVEKTRDAASRGILRRSTSKPARELSVDGSSKEPEVENVLQSTAEITLSNRKKAEEEQQSSTLWDNAAPGTPEEEIPEPEAPLRRPSPEGSADEHTRVATDSPVRSYKKFTFGKDGTCITESGRVYAQPKSDGSWTTVEKKTKITRRPSNATSVDEEIVRSPGPPPKDELTVPRSASGSSSESNDIFNDMFPDWRTSSPFGNLMRMKSSIKKLNKRFAVPGCRSIHRRRLIPEGTNARTACS
uniref:Putative serine/threonine protein n=1 Tax=Amblyomma triste TaxID=251400 RepID=A0A023G4P8_AMBTT